jgi:aspartyl-tRNA(Asn)/glutamyl-tRNA(Gln) amidotransferase subunit A
VSDLTTLGAVELAALYRQRDVSPVDVAQGVIERIARWEPQLQALYAYEPQAALAAARASEARWREGAPLSALDGVPVTIKENIATRGVPTPLGCAATVLAPAAADAPPAQRLREAGCVILGKTTMPDWGMLTSGLSSFHALTRNPWDLSKNPGGSSAGAAAACAAGYGPLHLGTDIGGSVRLPAALCGIVALKPSAGRVPIHPPYAGRVAGPMTRSVEDAAAMMGVLARPDARDATQLPATHIAWDDLDTIDLRGLPGVRVGLLLDAGWGLPADREVSAAVQAAAQRLQNAGAIVEPIAPFSTRAMADGMDHFWRMRSWLDYAKLPPERQALVLPYIRQWIARGAELSGAEVFDGYSQMAALRDAAVGAIQAYDFIVSPTGPVAGYPAEFASPQNDPERPFEHIAFTLPYNMSEQPALSLPCGFTAEGLPIGLQIAGHRHDDLGVLRLARAWERLRDPLPPWPEPKS